MRRPATAKYLAICFLLSFFTLLSPFSMLFARIPKDYFWRFYFGTGLGRFSDEPQGEDYEKLELEGQGGILRVKFAYMYFLNTSMDIGFSSITDNNPKVKREGLELDDIAGSYGAAALDLGLSHFFWNSYYIAPEIRYVFQVTEEFGGTRTRFKGLGFGITLGREWEWDSHLSLGLALTYISDRLDGDGLEIGALKQDYKGKANLKYYGIGLSLTYD